MLLLPLLLILLPLLMLMLLLPNFAYEVNDAVAYAAVA